METCDIAVTFPSKPAGPSKIERDEALDSATQALLLLGERMPASPGYGVYVQARKQLERMLKDLGYPCLPPPAQRVWVDIGPMPVKGPDDADPELANALIVADYDFKHAK